MDLVGYEPTAVAEIGGGYLVWLRPREKKTLALGALGGIIPFVYAYGGIFIVSAIISGRIVDKKSLINMR